MKLKKTVDYDNMHVNVIKKTYKESKKSLTSLKMGLFETPEGWMGRNASPWLKSVTHIQQ